MSTDQLLATHYFVLDGFMGPMEAVISDEAQYDGRNTFDEQFADLKELLRNATEGVQNLVRLLVELFTVSEFKKMLSYYLPLCYRCCH